MVCAFTGHRPEHLPWRTDETDARCAALKAVLQREVSALYQRGFSAFLCGMARGCDLYFAEAVLALRDAGELPDANLTAMLPCPSQAARWDAKRWIVTGKFSRGATRFGCWRQNTRPAACCGATGRWWMRRTCC